MLGSSVQNLNTITNFFILDTDGKAGWPFGTQTGQRSGELTANSD